MATEQSFEETYDAAVEEVRWTRRAMDSAKRTAKRATEAHKEALDRLQGLRRPPAAGATDGDDDGALEDEYVQSALEVPDDGDEDDG